jgi:2-polyprenyl-3-methyl-5-hydroxy-6-metoxy-1,4-benzoquinol methylase
VKFSQRSYRKELLDGDNIPFEEIRRNMQELDTINRRLGGHRVTMKGFHQLVKNTTANYESLSVVEIGSGGGDNLRFLKNNTPKQWNLQLTGIDINPKCIAYAEGNPLNAGIRFISSDYSAVQFQQKPDIIFSSLFCHHFTNSELVFMLRWMRQNARVGFFINDLHRHPLAYYSIKMLTAVFSKSRLVKHDAPLSVLRGFKRNEWKDLLLQAGITQAQCSWQWAFRWLVTCNT